MDQVSRKQVVVGIILGLLLVMSACTRSVTPTEAPQATEIDLFPQQTETAMTSPTHHESLQGLIGRALVDPTFRKDLLNGHRAERLAELELTPEEHRAASAVDASDLSAYARGLDQWITERAVHEQQAASWAAARGVGLITIAA